MNAPIPTIARPRNPRPTPRPIATPFVLFLAGDVGVLVGVFWDPDPVPVFEPVGEDCVAEFVPNSVNADLVSDEDFTTEGRDFGYGSRTCTSYGRCP